MSGVIYLIRNLVNNKVYVGQTTRTPSVRWREHLESRSECISLRDAIRKYGSSSFSFEILARATSQEELNQLERRYIFDFKSFPPQLGFGYNLQSGGQDEHQNVNISLEHKEKIRQFCLSLSPNERRAKSIRAQQKRVYDESFREKIRQAAKRRPPTTKTLEERRKQTANAIKARWPR